MEEIGGALLGVADGDHVHVVTDDEVFVVIFVFVDADGDDGDVWVLALKFDERRQLLNAGTAPGSPEIQQDGLATIAGEVHRAGAVRDGEIRRLNVQKQGTRATVAARGQGYGDDEREKSDSGKPHILIIRRKRPVRHEQG